MTDLPSPLQGGSMRRRRPTQRALLAVILIALAVGGLAVALIPTGDGEGGGASHATAATVPPAGPARAVTKPGGALPLGAPPGISMSASDAVKVHLNAKPAAALLFDLDTGRVLYRLHPLRVRPIASVTKLMTALLAVERLPYDATALIKKEAVRYTGSMLGVLPRGRRVAVATLMYGMLLPSANDAAVALADRMAGTDRDFARLMNERARELGLSCTHYVSSYGLQAGNRSCAADLAALTRIVMRQPRIARIARHRRANIRFPYLKGKHLQLYSTNPLMRLGYRGTIGLKTGFTDPAGHCFVGVVRRGGHTLGVVLLKSIDTGGQAMKLLDAGFRALKAGAV
jgi:serine-type D-Ala-D-Ala carboxypeptidase (penicillin-binding protein 5/6)